MAAAVFASLNEEYTIKSNQPEASDIVEQGMACCRYLK
jgi:hypothetical protein